VAIVGITSPPYANMISGGSNSFESMMKRLDSGKIKSEVVKKRLNNLKKNKSSDISMKGVVDSTYGKTVGQIGNLKDELSFSDEEINAGCNSVWHGCYEDGRYRSYFSKESLIHAAKISPILVMKIINHLNLNQKDTMIDFFSGTARIPLIASMMGYNSIGIELEKHFYEMSLRNQKHLENRLGRKLPCSLYKGDSRYIGNIINNIDIIPTDIKNENYSEAIRQFYKSAFDYGISPLVLVLKNPTKNKKVQRLDLKNIEIMNDCGYELYDYHKALLFEEVDRQ